MGNYENIKELRKKAIDYYKKNIQGSSVFRDDLGEIRFSRRGIEETLSKALNDEEALLLIPHLQYLIKTSSEIIKNKLEHIRKDKTDYFLTLKNKVKVKGIGKNVEIILKREKNYWYYCLFLNVTRYKKTGNYLKFPHKESGLLDNSLLGSITKKYSKVNSQNENYILNIFIKDEENKISTKIIDNSKYIKAIELLRYKLYTTKQNGGTGSGNWGHSGRLGLVGGSSKTKNIENIEIKGNELGNYENIKELRKKQ